MISNDYNFEIEETDVQVIEVDNYTIYTFLIERENPIPNLIENYILIENNNGSITHNIARYPYNIVSGKKVFLNNRTIEKINNPNLTILNRGSVTEQIDNPFCVWVSNGTGFYSTYFPPKKCGCDGLHDYGDLECSCPESPATLGSYQDVEYTFWVLDCSGGGSGNVDGANPADNPTGNTGDNNPPGEDPEDPTSQDEIITTPFVKGDGLEEEKTPCEILKSQTIDNVDLNHKLDSLKQRVLITTPNYDTTETAVSVERIGNEYIYNVSNNASSTSNTVIVTSTQSKRDVAHIHNHPNNSIPVFSYADIVSFYDSYNFIYDSRKNEYTNYLVCFNNTTYALRMDDISKLSTFFDGIDTNTAEGYKKAEEEMFKLFKKYGLLEENNPPYTQAMAEEQFMNVLNDPKMGSSAGISLYRKDSDGWGKLEKNGNTINKIPCNL